jgi:hypothetical protein
MRGASPAKRRATYSAAELAVKACKSRVAASHAFATLNPAKITTKMTVHPTWVFDTSPIPERLPI